MVDRKDSQVRPGYGTPSGWQARKSAATRRQIVEATLRCFVRLGYFHTTTPAIAQEAGLSRGAMLHHFPTRMDVVRAAVERLHAKRLKAFRAAVAGLAPGESRPHAAVRTYWQQLRHPLHAVFLELYVASRTDPDLAAILHPAEVAFVRELKRTGRELVPEWRVHERNFELGYQLITTALQGAALSLLRPGVDEPDEYFMRYIESRVDELARAESRQGAEQDAARTATQ